jgi:hypothetical protein
MEHYVTLFDSLFLPQGLALQLSMQRHAGEHTLWVICMDETVFQVLQRLNLSSVRLISLKQVETAELKRIKPSRSKVEYCWTMTPFAPRFVFEADITVKRVTYLDADMWFRKNPAKIFSEFDKSGKAVLITDHAYAPEYDISESAGQYCVQFLTFVRDRGEMVRERWEAQCVEWCYSRIEPGKFGDQKYLDEWPQLFDDEVHELNSKELLMAPWNATRYPYGQCVVWHFHGFRILTLFNSFLFFSLGTYPLPIVVKGGIYRQYKSDILESIEILSDKQHKIRSQTIAPLRLIFASILMPLKMRITLVATNMLNFVRYGI